jgi:hypothetical protein
MAALHEVPPPSQYTDGDDWVMDTGAISHMANHPGILTSSSPPLNTSIIVGNGSPLPVHHMGSSTIPTSSSTLHLCNVLISPHLIKNLISVHTLTLDNLVSVTFDPFGFSIKDFRTGRLFSNVTPQASSICCASSPIKTPRTLTIAFWRLTTPRCGMCASVILPMGSCTAFYPLLISNVHDPTFTHAHHVAWASMCGCHFLIPPVCLFFHFSCCIVMCGHHPQLAILVSSSTL